MVDAERDEAMDWSLATWDGARREALRRWASLPLERIVAALEEMQQIAGESASGSRRVRDEPGRPPGSDRAGE